VIFALERQFLKKWGIQITHCCCIGGTITEMAHVPHEAHISQGKPDKSQLKVWLQIAYI